ncbi:MAG: ApaG domain [Verrucomicrobiota bacterium]|nr:ApaG domain [Verrucomicrobiota bacterium]
MPESIHEPAGLHVVLDRLVYEYDPVNTPPGTPHIFVYFLTIRNNSDTKVTLLGRKWVIQQVDGETLVIEGDKIVGQTPTLAPGEVFSYNSFHITGISSRAQGSFQGIDDMGERIMVRIPAFDLTLPEEKR